MSTKSNNDSNYAEEDDINSHDDGSQQSNSIPIPADDDSLSLSCHDNDNDSNFFDSDESVSDDDSYYSSESSNSSSSSGDSYSENDSSRTSQHSSRSSRSEADQAIAVHSSNTSSTKRTFHRGVLPIMCHGLGGGDQNSDPNRNTLIQRRGKSAIERTVDDQKMHQRSQTSTKTPSDNNDGTRSRRRRRDNRSRNDYEYTRKNIQKSKWGCVKYLCCQTQKWSTKMLACAFVTWILAQCYYFYLWSWKTDHQRKRGMSGRERKVLLYHSDPANHRDMLYHPHSPEERAILRAQLMKEAKEVLGTAAGDDDFDPNYYKRDNGGKPDKINNRRRRGKSRDSDGSSRSERIREGCSALEWHSFHFPNCNEIHEINLRNVVRRRRSMTKYDVNSTAGESVVLPWGFVGNGLWRDVFACDPREEAIAGSATSLLPWAPAVLKVMKSEHPYDQRNLQRHRRDALVMERLSFSHNVVPIYGYCANAVLTQAISHTLDDVIFSRENEEVKKWSPQGGFVRKPPLESWMGRDQDGELLATRETELGRIRLALGVFRGLRDLHEGDESNTMEWLPIIHADLQSKQYLIDSTTGHIYLNDFNRCRFITKVDPLTNYTSINNDTSSVRNSSTLESCPVYIPSAPGIARAPEEYDMTALSEKLDIYSGGNILYEIITGKHIWDDERNKNTRAAIQRGERPQVNDTIRNATGTVDAELTQLLDRVYEHDPNKRPSAKEVVDQLEKMLDREMKRELTLSAPDDHALLDDVHEESYYEEENHRRELKLRRKL